MEETLIRSKLNRRNGTGLDTRCEEMKQALQWTQQGCRGRGQLWKN